MNWTLRVPKEPSDELPSGDGTWDAEQLAYVQSNFRQFGLLVGRDDPRVATHSLDEMESPETARDLFLAYDGLAAGSVGSQRVFSVRDRDVLEQVQIAMYAIGRLARITADSATPQSLTTAVHLPSSWHAAIWLTLRQLEARMEGRHMAFRGQADPRWDLLPSWTRVEDAERGRYLLRRRRFERAVADVAGSLTFDVDGRMLRAASQHHGFTSRLLDFTTDPLVAIWFALDIGGNGAQPDRVVWYRDVAGLRSSGCRFVLAPPFLRRLHAQRGFFIERRHGTMSLTPRMHAVTFKWWREQSGHFEPVWLGEATPIYPAVPWLDTLAEQTRSRDTELGCATARRRLLHTVKELARQDLDVSIAQGEHAVSTDHALPLHEGPWTTDTSSGLAYDALYRLAIVTEHREGTRGHLPLIRSIANSNPTIIRGLVKSIRRPPKGMAVAKSDHELAALLEDCLVDHDP
ncbi:MAG: FRG domain-containing protein [Planctomycetota bacterium]